MQKPPEKYSLNIQRPHVVLLGAGASRAAFPNGEKNGHKLPLMKNFIEVVDGLSVYLEGLGVDYKNRNIEDVYSYLYETYGVTGALQNIEEIVYDYFSGMELPDEPTLYDHLVLSLRHGDIIATFNWDPLLWQALCRNRDRVGDQNLPYYLFLHGNTAIGLCVDHEKISVGHQNNLCERCGKILQKCRLLYPITHKNYSNDPFIKTGWDMMKSFLKSAFMFTIFGYGAPESDVEAVGLLQEGWGKAEERNLEEIQIVDVVSSDELEEKWKSFIHTHHFSTHNSFYSTSIANHPRRSCDAVWNAIMDCNPREEYSVSKYTSWNELDELVKPYIEVENISRQNT